MTNHNRDEVQISIRLDEQTKSQFEKLSERNHRSMAGMIRFLIDREIDDFKSVEKDNENHRA
jgi:predicted DNA-binding protein